MNPRCLLCVEDPFTGEFFCTWLKEWVEKCPKEQAKEHEHEQEQEDQHEQEG